MEEAPHSLIYVKFARHAEIAFHTQSVSLSLKPSGLTARANLVCYPVRRGRLALRGAVRHSGR
jgi:hypothetical protein